MSQWARRWKLALRSLVPAAILGAGLTGCDKHDDPETASVTAPSADATTEPSPAASTSDPAPAPPASSVADALHQPFASAVRTCDDPPGGTEMPVNETT